MTGRLARTSRIFPLFLLLAMGSILWSDGWDLTCRLDPHARVAANRQASWDAALRSAGGAGLFLKFINFAPADRQNALEFYFRAVYLLYPQPVIVAPPGAVILLGWQLLDANLQPNDAWLQKHGVAAIELVDGKSGVLTPQPPRLIAAAPPAPSPQSVSLVWCAIYLAALLLAGYAVIGWLTKDLTASERFGLGAILGPGVFGYCLIVFSMLGHQPSRTQIVLLGALFGAMALLRSRMRVTRSSAPPPSQISERFLILSALLIGYGLVVVALDVSIFSTPIWDAFSIWQLKAKVLATAALYPRPAYFSDVRLSYSHLRYPVLWPMICAGIDAANQSLREGLGKIPAYLFYIGTGICIYGTIRRSRGRTAAIIAAGLVLTAPVVYRYGGSGTAEMALTAFYTASILCILRWQQEQRWGDLILCALFSAAMAWTKNEGQALALINGIVILLMSPRPLGRRNILAALAFAAIVIVLFAPWLLFIHPLPRSDEDYAGHLNMHAIFANLSAVPTIARAMIKESLTIKDWGIFWILLAALAVSQRSSAKSRAIFTLWTLLALQALAYFPPYIVTIWTLKPLLILTIDRMLMHMLPAAALLIGLLWPAPPPWLEKPRSMPAIAGSK